MADLATMSLGDLLRRHRQARNWTQEELAAKVAAGVDVKTIRNVEAGRHRPRLYVVQGLVAALDLPADESALVLGAWRRMQRSQTAVMPLAGAVPASPRRARRPAAPAPLELVTYRCSFCDASYNALRRFIAGLHGVYICDECVVRCHDLLEQHAEDGLAS